MRGIYRENNSLPISNGKPHYKLTGFLVVLPFLPIAVISFWVIHKFDILLIQFLEINFSNTVILFLVYGVVKIFFGFWFGLVYIPHKGGAFNSLIAKFQLSSQPIWSEYMRGIMEAAFAGFFVGMGFLGIMETLTMIVVQLLKNQ